MIAAFCECVVFRRDVASEPIDSRCGNMNGCLRRSSNPLPAGFGG